MENEVDVGAAAAGDDVFGIIFGALCCFFSCACHPIYRLWSGLSPEIKLKATMIFSFFLGVWDNVFDVLVMYQWYIDGENWWASGILASIFIAGLLPAFLTVAPTDIKSEDNTTLYNLLHCIGFLFGLGIYFDAFAVVTSKPEVKILKANDFNNELTKTADDTILVNTTETIQVKNKHHASEPMSIAVSMRSLGGSQAMCIGISGGSQLDIGWQTNKWKFRNGSENDTAEGYMGDVDNWRHIKIVIDHKSTFSFYIDDKLQYIKPNVDGGYLQFKKIAADFEVKDIIITEHRSMNMHHIAFMMSRGSEIVLESMPAGAIQLYVMTINILDGKEAPSAIPILSLIASILSIGYGMAVLWSMFGRNWNESLLKSKAVKNASVALCVMSDFLLRTLTLSALLWMSGDTLKWYVIPITLILYYVAGIIFMCGCIRAIKEVPYWLALGFLWPLSCTGFLVTCLGAFLLMWILNSADGNPRFFKEGDDEQEFLARFFTFEVIIRFCCNMIIAIVFFVHHWESENGQTICILISVFTLIFVISLFVVKTYILISND